MTERCDCGAMPPCTHLLEAAVATLDFDGIKKVVRIQEAAWRCNSRTAAAAAEAV